MSSKLPTLSTELYERLFEALLSCEEFDNNVRLQEFIKDGELALYHKWFLMYEYKTNEDRVENTIKYLIRQRLHEVKPALPLLLLMLRSTLIEGDALRDELEDLHNEVEAELLSFYKTSSSSKITMATTLPTSHTYHSSPLNSVKIGAVEDICLDPPDREWIISFVNNVIGHMAGQYVKGCVKYQSLVALVMLLTS
jgi:hypothetical protein